LQVGCVGSLLSRRRAAPTTVLGWIVTNTVSAWGLAMQEELATRAGRVRARRMVDLDAIVEGSGGVRT
jgi:hypothetical protein